MLKNRILTASVLLPLAIWGILQLPTILFSIISGILFTIGAFEWARLSGQKNIYTRCMYTLFIVQMGILGLRKITLSHQEIIFGLTLFFWLFFILGVILYPKGKKIWQNNFIGYTAGLIVLVPSYLALNWLRVLYSPLWVLLLMALIWTADSSAYFAGKRFGKHKLMVEVSPGKTYEGAAGALLSTILLSVLAYYYLDFVRAYPLSKVILLNLLTVGVSIFGDLFESLYKRLANVKDSGAIFPGHGGVLDRIDSLTVALPFYIFGLNFLNS